MSIFPSLLRAFPLFSPLPSAIATQWQTDESSLLLRDPRIEEYASAFIQIALEDSCSKLREIMSLPPLYSFWAITAAHALSSATSATVFFGGSWYDMLFAGILGGWVGVTRKFCSSHNFSRIYEVRGQLLIFILPPSTATAAYSALPHECY